MSPFTLSLVIFAALVAAGTLLGAPAIMLGMKLARGPRMGVGKGFMAAFSATVAAMVTYSIVLALLDRSTQSMIGLGFFAATLTAGFASYAAVMKFSDVYPERVPVVWAPYAVLLVTLLAFGRVQGWELRESYGFYRGYESIWVHNMPEAPEAMAHPEATVGYYNAQLRKLRRSAEETGMGHILTTFGHRDLQWLNENFLWICRMNAVSDPTGIERVIQDPRALKLLAVLAVARPIYGKVERSAILGHEAIVKMDSGQLVRLRKEGNYWKIRSFLGMKQILMQQIHEEKKRNDALTEEDQREAESGFGSYEADTRLLAERIGIEYQPFYPFMADPEGMAPADRAAAVLRSAQSSPAGGKGGAAQRSAPIELADLSYEIPRPPPIEQPPPLAELPPPPPIESAETESTGSVPATIHVEVAQETPDETTAVLASRPQETGTSSAQSAPRTSSGYDLRDALPLQATQDDVELSSSPMTVAMLRPSDVPVDTVWSLYFSALEKIEKNDPAGIDEFLMTVSQEDGAWFRANAPLLVHLVAPRHADRLSSDQTLLAVLKAMLRNMPNSPKARIDLTRKGGTAVARFTEAGPDASKDFTTILALEGSRWVMVHPFFARTFIWTPQLAWYKSGQKLPLTPEETAFLEVGYGPFQESVRAIYKSVGYSGGHSVVRHVTDHAVPASD